jgi:hypothetical protein|eukprot:scaffold4077_cov110-Alexandrium_tamarense.AAC.2
MNARSIFKHGLFAIIAGAIIHTIVTVVSFLPAYDLMSRNIVDDAVSVSSTVVKKPFMPLMRNVCGLDAVDELKQTLKIQYWRQMQQISQNGGINRCPTYERLNQT